jgi:RNA polymerase sigma factor (sigma-70 family)
MLLPEERQMATPSLTGVLGRLRTLAAASEIRSLSNRQLLEQFAARRDEAAFTELVRRHGPLVWSVCRNVLGHDQDAEDAFQATFLVLARRPASVRNAEALAGWLHGVAHRVALKAKRTAARRRRHEHQARCPSPSPPIAESAWRVLQAALDEEVCNLPDRLRAPFLLCCLQGKGPALTAQELGCKVATVHTRVSEARRELLQRLARRGVSLSAALCAVDLFRQAAASALPAALARATVQSVRSAAAGRTVAVAPHLVALVDGGLPAMPLGIPKTLLALIIALGFACVGAGFWARATFGPGSPAIGAATASAVSGPRTPSAQRLPRRDQPANDPKQIPIAGRVLNPAGQPVRSAHVMVQDRPTAGIRSFTDFSLVLADETRTDAKGRFQVQARLPAGQPPPSPVHPLPVIFVRANGYGVGFHAVTADARKEAVVIRLPRELVLHARFRDDMTGKPVRDLVVKVAFVAHAGGMVAPPAKTPRAWFPAMKTDAQGRLELRGIGTGQIAIVKWRDRRFRSQRLELWRTEAQQAGEEALHDLQPPLPERITGRVTFQDTGKPAAGVTVHTPGSETKTDRQGRFRLTTDWPPSENAPFSGGPIGAWVEADAPVGTGYLGGRAHTGPSRFPRPDGTLGPWLPATADISLPRGVFVRGRVLEAGSRKGIAGVTVQLLPERYAATSGADGAFSLTAPAGPGHFIAAAARADYVPVPFERRGYREFTHAVLPVNLKTGKQTQVEITLRKGAVVKGKLIGPDGRPALGAVLISRLNTSAATLGWTDLRAVPVAANFELRGCDPEKSYPVIFFQQQKGWGAVMYHSGKQAGKPLEVRLQRCGAASARFRSPDGKPVAGRATALDLRVVPAAGDSGWWGAFIEHSNIRKDWHTDAQGRVTWRNLVPGVTYRVNNRDFTVRPGQMLDLGDF